MAKITLAVLGGWLAIMPAAVLTVALRLRDFDASGLPTDYSAMLASGWLMMIVALIGFGQLGDALERQGRYRVVIIRISIPLLAAGGLTLMLATSPTQLFAAWIAAQLPTAAIVTSALALSGRLAPTRRGILSGLIGAASIVSLFLGSLIVQAFITDVRSAFLATSLLGAVLAVPLAVRPPTPLEHPAPVDRRTPSGGRRRWMTAWVAFTVASFLLSFSTSTTNSYLVLFVDRVCDVPAGLVASTSTSTVTYATVVAILASILSGLLVRGRRSAAAAWTAASTAVAAAVVVLLATPTATGILLGGIAFGIGFGVANGAELALLLFLRHAPGRLGRDLGIFTAATSAPYVLVPLAATVLLATDIPSGLRLMFTLAALMALMGAAITGSLARRRRTASA